MGILLPILILFGFLFVRAFRRHPDATGRALAVRRIALGLMIAYVTFFGLFVAGETFSDPGGWEAVGLVALWLVPMALLGLLAWFRPDRAKLPLVILTGVLVAVSLWYAFDAQSWRSFEDSHGPVRGIAAFALCAAIGLYGYHRPQFGGTLLLIASVVPVMLTAVASHGMILGSFGALTSPAALTGALYLWSLSIHGTAAPPSLGGTPTPNQDAPAGTR